MGAGTSVEENVFAGWDASNENVQIKTGLKTKSHSIVVRGNLCANPEIPVPDVAWEFIPFTDQAVEFRDAEWHVYEPDAQKESFEEGALCIFHFEGSRVSINILSTLSVTTNACVFKETLDCAQNCIAARIQPMLAAVSSSDS